jgi:hypothetical protein
VHIQSYIRANSRGVMDGINIWVTSGQYSEAWGPNHHTVHDFMY